MATCELTISDSGAATREAIEAPTQADAETQAQDRAHEWLRTGDWDTSAGAVFARCHWFLTDASGNEIASGAARMTLHPHAPKCIDGSAHEWAAPHALVGGLRENPGVFGHGGGVVINKVCIACGCAMRTDTWATDPSTGEQGLTSISYEPRKFADELDRERSR